MADYELEHLAREQVGVFVHHLAEIEGKRSAGSVADCS